jgi:cobalt transporter subunit CbtA
MTTHIATRILTIALIAGILAGLTATAVQMIWPVPLIHQAEVYEAAGHAAGAAAPAVHAHEHGAVLHAHEPWAPADGLERTAFTTLTNILIAFGFGLVLVAILVLRGRDTPRTGLLWGMAGFAVFSLAPAFGLPPELPGTEAAALGSRQGWWLATVVATGGGLALLVFGRHVVIRLCGLLLPLLPHLYGAPQPAAHGALAPPAMQTDFVLAALTSNAIMWVVLGALCGYLFQKSARAEPALGGAA